MKIIYHCYGGTHSSLTAAALHLGWLPDGQIPSSDQLQNLPYYDTQDGDDHGKLIYLGRDEAGNEVYVLGRRREHELLSNLISGLALALNLGPEDFMVVNVLSTAGLSMKLGGVLSRKFKLVCLGRPLVIWGTRRSFARINRLVRQVREKVGVPG